jgi:hypothetical protein
VEVDVDVGALETTERVLAALRLSPDRDAVIERLIRAIESDRAYLLSLIIGGHASGRPHAHRRRPVTGEL